MSIATITHTLYQSLPQVRGHVYRPQSLTHCISLYQVKGHAYQPQSPTRCLYQVRGHVYRPHSLTHCISVYQVKGHVYRHNHSHTVSVFTPGEGTCLSATITHTLSLPVEGTCLSATITHSLYQSLPEKLMVFVRDQNKYVIDLLSSLNIK